MRWLALLYKYEKEEENEEEEEDMEARRLRKSYCLVVVMRTAPLLVKRIWPTRGELAMYEYEALLVLAVTVWSRDAAS